MFSWKFSKRRVCEIDTDPFYLEAVPTAIHLIYYLVMESFSNSLSEIKKFIHFLLKYLQVLYVVHIVLVSNQKTRPFSFEAVATAKCGL